MLQSNKRKSGIIFFIAACVLVSIAATKPAGTETITAKNSTTNDTGFFKNLQVLPKNISKDSLDMIMDHFKAALGVRCNFCHAMGSDGRMDFASDDKEEKGIARYMMKMTMDINTKYFNFEKSEQADTITVVKCVTCHHGNAHPDSMDMGGDEHHDMPPPPQGDHPPMDSTGKPMN